jgi:hypothetical protein
MVKQLLESTHLYRGEIAKIEISRCDYCTIHLLAIGLPLDAILDLAPDLRLADFIHKERLKVSQRVSVALKFVDSLSWQ